MTVRKCRSCGIEKPSSEFNRNKTKKDGYSTECKQCCVEYRKAYRAKNKEKLKATDAAYYASNAERVKANVAAYRVLNKDKLNAAVAAYYEAHKEQIAEYQARYRPIYKSENPEKYARSKRAWEKANAKRRLIHAHNRRVKERSSGKLSVDIAERLFVAQGGMCACCGESLSGGYHIDHIMPLALGGSNTDDNIQLLLPVCNLRKGAKHPDAYKKYRKLFV